MPSKWITSLITGEVDTAVDSTKGSVFLLPLLMIYVVNLTYLYASSESILSESRCISSTMLIMVSFCSAAISILCSNSRKVIIDGTSSSNPSSLSSVFAFSIFSSFLLTLSLCQK